MELKNITSVNINDFKLKGFALTQEELVNCDQNSFICSINALKEEILREIYPVGSVYMNFSTNSNPHDILGFGTWQQVTDKYVYAADSTPSVGGNEYITVSMLPSHTHDFDVTTSQNGSHSHDIYVYVTHDSSDRGGGKHMTSHDQTGDTIVTNWAMANEWDGVQHSHTVSGYTNKTGKGTAKNLPSFQSYYIWIRTA